MEQTAVSKVLSQGQSFVKMSPETMKFFWLGILKINGLLKILGGLGELKVMDISAPLLAKTAEFYK